MRLRGTVWSVFLAFFFSFVRNSRSLFFLEARWWVKGFCVRMGWLSRTNGRTNGRTDGADGFNPEDYEWNGFFLFYDRSPRYLNYMDIIANLF
ncbi:hypothetical protein F4810DRAFT_664101 [Camillea tinctor]|nr:hypothetical protein F4810DRAFT_664101 [Camillea tinctor]